MRTSVPDPWSVHEISQPVLMGQVAYRLPFFHGCCALSAETPTRRADARISETQRA